MKATFDSNDHAVTPGWGAYMKPLRSWRERIHGWFGHTVPAETPIPRNGHSPSNYAKCICGAALKWYVVGQHRYGSLSRENDATLTSPG